MATQRIRLLYYVNQFFGGIGGEDRADHPLEIVEGGKGPAIGLVRALEAQHGIGCAAVTTLVCGDNYFTSHGAEVAARVTALLHERGADLFVAGPAFLAGRYGLACAALCAAADAAGIPALTAMSPENPGAEGRASALIVATGDTAGAMTETLPKMARLAAALVQGQPLPSALEGGYLARGSRREVQVGQSAAARAVSMVTRLLAGQDAPTEIPLPRPRGRVVPAAPVADLGSATIALVCEGGLVPRGNPDRIPTARAANWGIYPIPAEGLRRGDYEVSHGGIDARWGTEEPYRLVPWDAATAAKSAGRVGRVLDKYLVTTGNGGRLQDMARIGREMAAALRREGVDAVVLTGT
jgi:glycine reductase complex component B subunit gamma